MVADRAEHEGERILPAKITLTKEPHKYQRLSKQEVEAKIEKIKRGRFKVYIGAAPGVGKTYTMLREGNDHAKKRDRCARLDYWKRMEEKRQSPKSANSDIIPRAEDSVSEV